MSAILVETSIIPYARKQDGYSNEKMTFFYEPFSLRRKVPIGG